MKINGSIQSLQIENLASNLTIANFVENYYSYYNELNLNQYYRITNIISDLHNPDLEEVHIPTSVANDHDTLYKQKTVIETDVEELREILKQIVLALKKGTHIEEISLNINIEILNFAKDQLLNHPDSPISKETLLMIASYTSVESYNNEQHSYFIDPIKKQHQAEIIRFAIEQGADLTAVIVEEGGYKQTIVEDLLIKKQFELIGYAQEINPSVKYEITTFGWLDAIFNNYNIGFITQALVLFPGRLDKSAAYDLLRSYGGSHSLINGIFDAFDLAGDFLAASCSTNPFILSKNEIQILDSTNDKVSFSNYTNANYVNSYGFSPLSLALLSEKHDLAAQMISAGENMVHKNKNGITPLQILRQLQHSGDKPTSDKFKTLMQITLEKLDNIDIILNENGESIVDNFLTDDGFKAMALSKTNDPLFEFYKENANLFSPSLNPDITHIGISMGEGFWSTGLNALSRLISEIHPNVKFHLVTLEMMERGGDEFLKQFNGWINPGAGDSFPVAMAEFNKKDWQKSSSLMILEQAYQKALAKTEELHIPYLGMCAGAQNFVLHHDGYLSPVEGYAGGKDHIIYYQAGTLAHFMVMTNEQQKNALQNCDFPEITFKGDTAHHYAAVANKIGVGIQLGAVSEEGVPMSYAHENGLRYATQFHPEHYYHENHDAKGGINHQKIWLENFIDLTILHHNHAAYGFLHPEMIFEQISLRLEECVRMPVCKIGQNIFNNSTIDYILFSS